MSSTVDLVEKNKILLESINTGNGANKTIDVSREKAPKNCKQSCSFKIQNCYREQCFFYE